MYFIIKAGGEKNMKLNATILANALESSGILQSYRLEKMSMERKIEGYTVYEEGISVDDSLLYILSDTCLLDIFHENRYIGNITAVCLFAQEERFYQSGWNYLFLKKEALFHGNQVSLNFYRTQSRSSEI